MASQRIDRESRRGFLADVGRGTLLACLGSSMAMELGFVSPTFAAGLEDGLDFGDLEPLVDQLQQTPADRLQPWVVDQLKRGVKLESLIGAAALANARTFGGEDYVGFHTFMALAPALRMSRLMPSGAEPLPVLKVLYRNANRIQEFGGGQIETLREVVPASGESEPTMESLRAAIAAQDTARAEQLFAALVARDPQLGLDTLLPVVQDSPEVHRTVLPFRAWEMREIVGSRHALTLLRQSLRYCLRSHVASKATETSEHGRLLAAMFDEYHLDGAKPGSKPLENARLEALSETFATASPDDAARAAAEALAEGVDPASVGEAISLAASLLVLRDPGRSPQNEDKAKPPGCVHGDSVGVHASDSANAWRNLARAGSGRNQFGCLISGAWSVARDRVAHRTLMDPLPAKRQLEAVAEQDAESLLRALDEAIRYNLQGRATAVAHRYGELGLPADRFFAALIGYAVSEDGALHAEKYFQTVWDDFHATRPSLRWRHLTSLARVTASEYGLPAPGQEEARQLLGVVG